MIRFDILTIFPDQITQYLQFGVTRIATEAKLLEYHVHDLRKWTTDKHKTVDDRPYGGGAGMVMKVEPVFNAVKAIKEQVGNSTKTKVLIMTPVGKTLDQALVKELVEDKDSHYILLCGHYEGFDNRIHQHIGDMEISIGNYVLSGGELASLVIIDSITRLVPGVLGNENSIIEESFENDSLEYPQYTRPEEINGWSVPPVLLSGNHAEIEKWRVEQSKKL